MQDFNFLRLPDARSGSFQPTIADFLAIRRGEPWFIEVKEVDHEYRLPSKNFNSGQRARLQSYEMAGAGILVVIKHTPTKVWRIVQLGFFEGEPPSWDLSKFACTKSLGEVLDKFLGIAK